MSPSAQASAIVAFLILGACGKGAAQSSQTPSPAVVTDLIPQAGTMFRCTPTKVYDGDGPVWCEEGQRIRLAGIAAREMDGTCRDGHPCPDASAEEARATLVRMVSGRIRTPADYPARGHVDVTGPPLSCTSTGPAGGKRVGAWCISPTAGDLSCAMLASGTVAKWGRYWKGHGCR